MTLSVENSKTGKPRIEYNNYKYRERNVLKNGDVVWRCLGAKCKSFVKTNASRTEVIEARTTHVGPHPTTMRTVMSLNRRATPSPRASVPPAAETDPSPAHGSPRSPSPLDTPALSAPGRCSVDPETPRLAEYTTPLLHRSFEDLLQENLTLKEEVATLNNKYNDILNHAAENDMRLLKFTSEIFTSPLSKERKDPSAYTPAGNSPTHPLQPVNQQTQTEPLCVTSCQSCKILKEEAANMIDSIRVLERELSSLRQQSSAVSLPSKVIRPTSPEDLALPITPCVVKDDGGFTIVRRKRRRERKKKNNVPATKQTPLKKLQNINRAKKQSPISLPFKNVTIMGDSHARHLAGLIGGMVPHTTTTVTGLCKPNAGLLDIVPTGSSTTPSENCYVLIAGTNDVGSGRQEVIFQHLEASIQRCKAYSKVLVCTLPYRHDLESQSPIHNTINVVNNYIEELCSRHEGVAALNIGGLGRRLYTAHGMHLQMRGKRALAALIVEALTKLPGRQPVARGRRTEASAPISSSSTSSGHRTTPGTATFAEAVRGQPPTFPQTSLGRHPQPFLVNNYPVTGRG